MDNINYRFEKGKIYALLGHNGAGKTTLIRLCLKILSPRKGEIIYDENLKFSYVPDFGGLYQFLTVEQNIQVFLELNNIQNNYAKKFVDEALKIWKLEHKQNALVKDLSMGLKQRLSIILAEATDPDIIFLDEPTNSIDIKTQEMLAKHLTKLKNQGKTIILSSHDLGLIEDICDEIIILDNNHITYSGIVDDNLNLNQIYQRYTDTNDKEEE